MSGQTAWTVECDIGGHEYRPVIGHWIIKGVAGEFYPCKPDIFEFDIRGGGRLKNPSVFEHLPALLDKCGRAGCKALVRAGLAR